MPCLVVTSFRYGEGERGMSVDLPSLWAAWILCSEPGDGIPGSKQASWECSTTHIGDEVIEHDGYASPRKKIQLCLRTDQGGQAMALLHLKDTGRVLEQREQVRPLKSSGGYLTCEPLQIQQKIPVKVKARRNMAEKRFPWWNGEVNIATETCAAFQCTHYNHLLAIFPHHPLACHLVTLSNSLMVNKRRWWERKALGWVSECKGYQTPRRLTEQFPLHRLRMSWARLSL